MEDSKSFIQTDIVSEFRKYLDKRSCVSRKNVNNYLSTYSEIFVILISQKKYENLLLSLLTEKIDYIISDCDTYFNMPREKANDSIRELSNLASLYVYKNDLIYNRIVTILTRLQNSYPI
jgi:hypothetical protein